MNTAENQALWNQRAALRERAGTDDLPLKRLEQRALLEALTGYSPDAVIVDLGCGIGETAALIATRLGCVVLGIDNSSEMLKQAKHYARRPLICGSVEQIPEGVHAIYTQRMLINLPTWDDQLAMLQQIASKLQPGGRYLMCESSLDGLRELNEGRASLRLDAIEPPPHTLYIRDYRLSEYDIPMALLRCWKFSSSYYQASRFFNAKAAQREHRAPAYDAMINEDALSLPLYDGPYAQTRMWIWEKRS